MRPQIMPRGKPLSRMATTFHSLGTTAKSTIASSAQAIRPTTIQARRPRDDSETYLIPGVLREHVADDLADDEGGLELDLRVGEVEAFVRGGGEGFAEGVDAEVGGERSDDRVGVHHRCRRSLEPGRDSAALRGMIGGSLIRFLQPNGATMKAVRSVKGLCGVVAVDDVNDDCLYGLLVKPVHRP